MLHKKNKVDALFVEANRLSRFNEKRVLVERLKRSRKDVRAADMVIGNDEVCASSDHMKTKTKRNKKGNSTITTTTTKDYQETNGQCCHCYFSKRCNLIKIIFYYIYSYQWSPYDLQSVIELSMSTNLLEE